MKTIFCSKRHFVIYAVIFMMLSPLGINLAHAMDQVRPAQKQAEQGEMYRLMGDYSTALAYFDRAIELKPNYTWAYAHRGETRRQMGDCPGAVDDLDRAINLSEDYAWAYAHRGESHRCLGDYTSALADFNRALELSPLYSWLFTQQEEDPIISPVLPASPKPPSVGGMSPLTGAWDLFNTTSNDKIDTDVDLDESPYLGISLPLFVPSTLAFVNQPASQRASRDQDPSTWSDNALTQFDSTDVGNSVADSVTHSTYPVEALPAPLQSPTESLTQPDEIAETSPALSYTVFLPTVLGAWRPPVNIPGLTLTPPEGWEATGITSDQVAGLEMMRLDSPNGTRSMLVTVNWFVSPPPESTFGDFEMQLDYRYEEYAQQLPSGELVQIMRGITDMEGSIFPVAHAAFRSERASYSLALYEKSLNEQDWNIFLATLMSATPNSITLPDPVPQAEEGKYGVSNAASELPSTNTTQAVSYDRNAAERYTRIFVQTFDNADDCYLWINSSNQLRCSFLKGYWGVDGAHFVQQALRAGGLPVPGLWNKEALRARDLRSWLLSHGGKEVSSPSKLKKGDVIFYGRNGTCWGWAGVVIDGDRARPKIRVHSIVTPGPYTVHGKTMYYDQVVRDACGTTNRHSYVHIKTAQEEPAPLINQSLTRSPATPFAGQPVTLTFRVCNYSPYTPFDTNQLYVRVSSPGTDFPSVNPPSLAPGNPGGCYTYQQTLDAFPTAGWYTIRAGYEEDGSFLVLDTVSGKVNEQTFYVVSPDVIQLRGDLIVTPEIIQQGDFVTVRFTVVNTGDATVTDRFRVHLYNENYPDPSSLVAEFATSGDVTLGPGEAYTYEGSRMLGTPGIYWIAGEHWAGGDWQPVYGDSVKPLRVMYPMPSKPKLAKGMPPFIALAGEPASSWGNFVHEHTDLIIPLPGVPFDVTRYSNHTDAAEILGPFGYGSTWSLSWRIIWRADKTAVLIYPDGRETYLVGELDPDDPFNLAGEYVGQLAETQRLVRAEDGTAVLEGNDQLYREFDAQGRLVSVRDGAGEGLTIIWDVDGHIEKVTHTSGAVFYFTYTGDYITAISSPDGWKLTYTYSPAGDLLSATSAAGDTMTYTYDDRHRMLTITDALGQRFLLNEYADDRVVRQTDASGVRSGFEYASDDTMVFYDQAGVPITYTHDIYFRIIRVEDARGAVTTYEWDEDFNLVERVDPMGGVWRWTHDDRGRVTSSTNPLGATWLYFYDDRGNLIEMHDPLGCVWKYEYDEHDNLIREIDPEGGVTVREYDDHGLVIREVDPEGATRTFVYNDMGLPVKIVDELGGVITMTYDVYGNRTSYTDAEGRTTYATFDAAGRMLSTTGPSGNTIVFTHDANGNLLSESDGAGHVRTYRFDEQDRPIEYTDFAGNVWELVYDELGRLIRREDPLGGVEVYGYDDVGNLVVKRDPRGGLWQYEYDLNGRLIAEVDPLGNETRYEHDAAGQMVAIDRPCPNCPGGRAVEMIEYDLAGRVIARTDGQGNTTRYEYDCAGRKVAEIDALGNRTRYVYSARGDLVEIVDALGHSTHREYNAAGWLIKETNRLGHTTIIEYDAVGNVISIQDARGNVTRYEYDDADRLVRMIDALGDITRYEYDSRGNLVKKTDALGRETTYTYDANNNLTSVTDPRGNTTRYERDALGRMTKMVDAAGGEWRYEYNHAGDLVAETDPRGCTRRFEYDLLGRLIAQIDRNGNTTEFEYDAAGDLVRVVDALGGETTYTYDANHNVLTETNALDHTTTFEYDPLNRPVRVVDALGGISTRTYDPLGRLIEETDANENTTRHSYDAEGQLIATVDALGHVTRYVYDPAGNLVQVTDRNGHVTGYVYDDLNRQVEVINALGNRATTRYDAVGNPIEVVDFRGHATRFDYDADDNLVHIIDALGGKITYAYDVLDRLVAATDANGNTTAYAYDPMGNLLRVTLPEGQSISYTYDCEGNHLAFTNAKGKTTTYEYDVLNRPISETDPMGHMRRVEYDAVGQVIRRIDGNDNATSFGYDPLGRPTAVTDALGHTTTYTYDPVGNLLAETDANDNTTAYEYGPLNRLVAETNPLNNTWTYTYDPEGNLIRQVDAKGQVITYEFDAVDQLVAIHYPDPDQDVTFEYDPNGNMVRMVDAVGETMLVYDALNREISKVDPYGRDVKKAYDPVGNLLSIAYPSGDRVTYSYNGNNWLVAMTDPRGGETTYRYGPDSLLIRADFPNGTWTDLVYNEAGRLVRKLNGTTHGTGLITAYEYTLDAEGNRLQTIERYTSGQVRTITKTYTYNARYELLRAVEVYEGPPSYTVTTTYTYDPVGNRLSMTTNRDVGPGPQPAPETIYYTYDAANHLLSAGNVNYTYDANGNRTTKWLSGRTPAQTILEVYEYDFENRMVRYTRSRVKSGHVEQRVYNVYDGLGRRLAKGTQEAQGAIKWVQYVVDGLGYDQLAEYPQTGASRTTQLYRGLGGSLVSMAEIQGDGPGNQYWFAADGLGSVAATTKHNGQSVHEYFFDPYGQIIDGNGHWEDSSSWTNPHNHYLLTGKEWDEESRLYYFGARFYDSEAGVWLTQDPYRGDISSPMTRHRTLYVRNNPVNRIDPLGFFDFQTGAVEWGDTWESIATQWDTNAATLRLLNSWVDTLRVGDYLQLPECRSAQCQLRLGVTEVRIGGLSGTACGQRIIQQQRAWLAELQARQKWQQKIRELGIEPPSGMNSSQLSKFYNDTIAKIESMKSAAQKTDSSGRCGAYSCCASMSLTPLHILSRRSLGSASIESERYNFAETLSFSPEYRLRMLSGQYSGISDPIESGWYGPEGKLFDPLNVELKWENVDEDGFGWMPTQFTALGYKNEEGIYQPDFRAVQLDGGLKIQKGDEGWTAGLIGQFALIDYESDWVFGNKNLGFNFGPHISLFPFELVGGIHENSLQLKASGSLVEGGGHIGFNILGINIGVEIEGRLGGKVGGSLGKKIKLDAGSGSIGITIDSAK